MVYEYRTKLEAMKPIIRYSNITVIFIDHLAYKIDISDIEKSLFITSSPEELFDTNIHIKPTGRMQIEVTIGNHVCSFIVNDERIFNDSDLSDTLI